MNHIERVNFDRRDFLKATAATAAGTVLGARAARAQGGATAAARPNIIFILADDQTPASLGCFGGRTPTPNLDRLAREGALFTSCYSVSALCNPTRYTILTGQFAGRNPLTLSTVAPGEPYSVLQNTRLTPDIPCIAPMLAAAGYATGFVGKWHSNFEIAALGVEDPPPHPKPEDLDKPGTDAQLALREERFAEVVKRAARFEWASRVQWGNLRGGTDPLSQHNPEWMTEGALEFIESAVCERRPFFLHLANSVPHAPNVCVALETDPRYTLGGKRAEAPTCHPPRATIAERLKKAGLPVSSQQVGSIMLDDQVGAILAKLKERGQDENTIVMFAQDNGQLGKGSCYRGGVHSALLMRWPAGIQPGTVVRQDVSFVDFVPTFLEAAGAPRPSGYRPDGVSFLPAVREGRPLPRGAVYSEVGVTRSVIKGRYHYIAFRPTASQIASMESGKVRTALDHWGRPLGGDNHWLLPYKPAFFDPDQLYDMEGDPLERTNLAGDPAHAAVLAEMKQELAKYLAGFKTPFPMEVSPFVSTPRYAELVAARRAAAAKGNYWPGYPEEDWERNINLNLKTPEEVDPSHRSAWQGKARDQASNVERQTSDAQRSTTEEPDEAE